MQDKIKFALIGLGAAIIIMLFLLLQSGQYVSRLKADKENLSQSNNSLNAQLASLNKENKQIKEEFNNAKKTLERLDKEKNDAEKAFKALVDENNRLKSGVAQLNSKLATVQVKAPAPAASAKAAEESISPAADAYWAGVLKKKAELELRLDGVRQELKTVRIDNEQLRREKDKLSLDLQTYESEQKDAIREFEYNKKLADNLTAELAREKNDKFQIAENLKSLRTENRFLKQQLKIIYDRKTRLEDKFSALQDKNAALESNMAKMESFVREKILQVDSLKNDLGIASTSQGEGGFPSGDKKTDLPSGKKESIELAPIVVNPQEENSPDNQKKKVFSVVAINKDNNFVVVNIGSDSGVKNGDTIQVFRNDDPVAILEVIQARENISACDIKSENTPIAVGDTVR
jgi:predicted nuclease with TOPRIM domain